MKTTLNKIREHSPCADGWRKLLEHLGKTQADDEPLSLLTILESNGLRDALWCLRAVEGHDREIRLLAVKYARMVQRLMRDPRSIAALDVAERYANGEATKEELTTTYAAACAACDAAEATWLEAETLCGAAAYAAHASVHAASAAACAASASVLGASVGAMEAYGRAFIMQEAEFRAMLARFEEEAI